jgi:hypothetical protein
MRKKEETSTLNNDKVFQFIRMKWMAVTHTKHGDRVNPSENPQWGKCYFRKHQENTELEVQREAETNNRRKPLLHQGLSYAAFIRSGWDNGCIKWYSPVKT